MVTMTESGFTYLVRTARDRKRLWDSEDPNIKAVRPRAARLNRFFQAHSSYPEIGESDGPRVVGRGDEDGPGNP